jgi:hypothetical protein
MAGQLVSSGDPGAVAVTGTVDPLPPAKVEGGSPTRSAVAGFGFATAFESMDAPPAYWSPPRILSSGYSGSTPVAVADIVVPAGLTRDLFVKGAASRGGTVVELYDWVAHAWVAFDPDQGRTVTAAQRGPGLIRIRYSGAANYALQVTAP